MSTVNSPIECEQPRSTNEADQAAERIEATCPECDGRIVSDEERAETVCEDCGLVVEEEEVDRGPEWRAFDPDNRDEKSRVGAPRTKLMHDEGLSSQIGWEDEDAYGNTLNPQQRKKIERLRTWDERFRTKNSQERNLKQALGELERMGSALGLPEHVRETAAVIYRRALDEDLLPGRSIEGVATASLYGAARQIDMPCSLDEMDAVSRIDRQELERTYRYQVHQLNLEIEPADPTDYLPRFASDVGVSDEVARGAQDLLQTAQEKAIHAGKSPISLAAAVLYGAAMVSGEEVTQDEVAEAANVSVVTIRNRYQEVLNAADSSVSA